MSEPVNSARIKSKKVPDEFGVPIEERRKNVV